MVHPAANTFDERVLLSGFIGLHGLFIFTGFMFWRLLIATVIFGQLRLDPGLCLEW
jgi:hypothetical protein